MKLDRTFLPLALALLVAGCAPATTYTDAEAPKRIQLDSATTQVDLHFAPGTASLSVADAARLRRLAAAGSIGASDRVIVAADGAPRLAEARAATVASVLVPYGVVALSGQFDVGPNRGVVAITRTLVTLPPCPNWSKTSGVDYGNQPSSNFGCASETNLGMMIAYPTDLASGLPVGLADGHPAASAVNRYLNDKVELPAANTALPVATQSSNQQGNGSNNASTPSGTGSGTGGS